MFKLAANSLFFEVSHPQEGMAHLGLSPQGPSDRLSFTTAFILLGEPENFKAVEILFCKEIRFEEELLITLVGASSKHLELRRGNRCLSLHPATVYSVSKGDLLHIGTFTKGAKLYLMATSRDQHNQHREGVKRGAFGDWFAPPSAIMRFFKGAEFDTVHKSFFTHPWSISHNSDRMGLRLTGERLPGPSFDIISSAVCEGTVQLTNKGPILLMSHHQTTGGYPRILQLSAVDIPTLSQYPLGSSFRAEYIHFEEAKELLWNQTQAMNRFKQALI